MILAIDPSINDVGLAFVDPKGKFISSFHLRPANRKTSMHTRMLSLREGLAEVLIDHGAKISEVVIEHTRFFARSKLQSHASAQKLNLAKGMLYGFCLGKLDVPVHLVWIPGFSKEQANLLSRSLGLPKEITQHEKDAFWLANTWATLPEIKKNHFLKNSD